MNDNNDDKPGASSGAFNATDGGSGEYKLFTPEEIDLIIAMLRENLGERSPLLDSIVKKLFGIRGESEWLLKDFLNAIRDYLGFPLFEEVYILPSENIPEKRKLKTTLLDVKAVDSLGNWYNLEIQLCNHWSFVSRTIYYGTKIHGAQLKRGSRYSELKQTICIVLTNFNLFPELPGAIRVFKLADEDQSSYKLSDMVFVFIHFSCGMEQSFSSRMNPALAGWLRLLNYPRTKDEIMKESISQQPVLSNAAKTLAQYAADNYDYLYDEDKAWRDETAWIEENEQESFQKGKAEGIAEGKARGIAEKSVSNILRRLWRKFEREMTPELDQRIRQLPQAIDLNNEASNQRLIDTLDELLDSAYEAESLEEFVKKLQKSNQ